MKGLFTKLLVITIMVIITAAGCMIEPVTENEAMKPERDWSAFAADMAREGFLPAAVVDDMPGYREQEHEEGGTLYLWSAWNADDDSFEHKLELTVIDGEPVFYHYKTYYYNPPELNEMLTMSEAEALALRFAAEYIPGGENLTLINGEAYSSIYDPGVIEQWYSAGGTEKHYIISVDMRIGAVVHFSMGYTEDGSPDQYHE
ncbi:MAG: hypothetical protein LBS19_12365 [Clostridiales bacterium]|jgi:hypothetical protein|nr:hypothetical protein [Clostridiales bacterium]